MCISIGISVSIGIGIGIGTGMGVGIHHLTAAGPAIALRNLRRAQRGEARGSEIGGDRAAIWRG